MQNALNDIEHTEANGLLLRTYFEDGCVCIRDKKIQKMASSVPNWDAVAYYEKACTCSRNYVGG